MASFQQLKGVKDLQTVLHVRNETNLLWGKLKITKNLLNAVNNDADAKKQSFIAHLCKDNSIEHKLEFSVKALDNDINSVSETLQYKQNPTEREVKQMQYEIQTLTKVQHLNIFKKI